MRCSLYNTLFLLLFRADYSYVNYHNYAIVLHNTKFLNIYQIWYDVYCRLVHCKINLFSIFISLEITLKWFYFPVRFLLISKWIDIFLVSRHFWITDHEDGQYLSISSNNDVLSIILTFSLIFLYFLLLSFNGKTTSLNIIFYITN